VVKFHVFRYPATESTAASVTLADNFFNVFGNVTTWRFTSTHKSLREAKFKLTAEDQTTFSSILHAQTPNAGIGQVRKLQTRHSSWIKDKFFRAPIQRLVGRGVGKEPG
jgi:hypothetical protein